MTERFVKCERCDKEFYKYGNRTLCSDCRYLNNSGANENRKKIYGYSFEFISKLRQEIYAEALLNNELFRGKRTKLVFNCSRCGKEVERACFREKNTCADCQRELMIERSANRKKLGI